MSKRQDFKYSVYSVTHSSMQLKTLAVTHYCCTLKSTFLRLITVKSNQSTSYLYNSGL